MHPVESTDRAVAQDGIDCHKSPLRKIGIDLSSFDGARSESIGFLLASRDRISDTQRQFYCRRRHLFHDQVPNSFLDGRTGDGGLKIRLVASAAPSSQTYHDSSLLLNWIRI
jgi:hypothetical protein